MRRLTWIVLASGLCLAIGCGGPQAPKDEPVGKPPTDTDRYVPGDPSKKEDDKTPTNGSKPSGALDVYCDTTVV